MNWWSRADNRYVEYGSSFGAVRRHGINRQIVDTVYRMNNEHLSPDALTVFESLDDADVRTAGTTYLMYRGRHDHQISRETAITRIAGQTLFRRPIKGPRELFYADLYASRQTGCRSQFGMPGIRDQHSGCVSAYLVEHDLFDFLLLSLPDNDTHSHKYGPARRSPRSPRPTARSSASCTPAAGPEKFLDEHVVIVVADHSHAQVEQVVDLFDALKDFDLRGAGARADTGEIAICPNQRAAMVYLLGEPSHRRARSCCPRAHRLPGDRRRRPRSCTARTRSRS
jgi:predicted AlkP superfamily pyrophosphatase or phosphodiesterase